MKIPLPRGMATATRLTRTGKLAEATALIQTLLRPEPPRAPSPDDAIDAVFERLDTPEPAPARTPLGATLRRIRSGGMPFPQPVSPDTGPLPEGATFTTHTHAGPEGVRDYSLYLPAAARTARKPLPLVIMLHGCTQSPDDFASGTGMNHLAEDQGIIVAYPAQPTGANANRCWNWFNPADQSRDRGEPALIAGIVRDILRSHPADAARVYVAGLSAGGAAAAILANAYPDVFAAAGVHSGLPVGAASDVASAFAAMRSGATGTGKTASVPVIVFHGDADATVNPKNGAAVLRQSVAAFAKLDTVIRPGTAPGGRAYRQTRHLAPDGRSLAEHWLISGAGHAWSGGHAAGSHTDPAGPDASAEMLRFFLQHRKTG